MITFRLHGLDCHVCGLPAQWFCDGATLPCGCGIENAEHRDLVLKVIARTQQLPPRPEPTPVPMCEVRRQMRKHKPKLPELTAEQWDLLGRVLKQVEALA